MVKYEVPGFFSYGIRRKSYMGLGQYLYLAFRATMVDRAALPFQVKR